MLIRLVSFQRTPATIISLVNCTDKIKSQLPDNVNVITLNNKTALGLLLSSLRIREFLPEKCTLYCWMYHANFVGALLKITSLKKINLIWGVRHSLDDYRGESISTKIAIVLGRLLKRVPDKVVNCSLRSQIQHINFGYNFKYNAVHIPYGYYFEPLQRRDLQKSKFVIGAAGRFHAAKDY